MKVVQPHRNRKNGHYNGRASKAKDKKGISVKRVDEYLRFAVFLAVIGMFYIWNSYKAEAQIREMEVVEKEVKDLKSKYLLHKSTLSAGTRFSEIRSTADSLGLRQLRQPPMKIVRESETQ